MRSVKRRQANPTRAVRRALAKAGQANQPRPAHRNEASQPPCAVLSAQGWTLTRLLEYEVFRFIRSCMSSSEGAGPSRQQCRPRSSSAERAGAGVIGAATSATAERRSSDSGVGSARL